MTSENESALRVRRIGATERAELRRFQTECGTAFALEAELDRGLAEVWVAEWRPGAFAACAVLWRSGDEWELADLVTRPEDRRRGIARGLVHHLLGEARLRGGTALHLEVRRGNAAALALYQALGFELGRVRASYYSDGEDAVEMRHSLA